MDQIYNDNMIVSQVMQSFGKISYENSSEKHQSFVEVENTSIVEDEFNGFSFKKQLKLDSLEKEKENSLNKENSNMMNYQDIKQNHSSGNSGNDSIYSTKGKVGQDFSSQSSICQFGNSNNLLSNDAKNN